MSINEKKYNLCQISICFAQLSGIALIIKTDIILVQTDKVDLLDFLIIAFSNTWLWLVENCSQSNMLIKVSETL